MNMPLVALALALLQEPDRMTVRAPTADEIARIEAAAPSGPPAKPAAPRRLLVLGHRPSHFPVAFCEEAMRILARKTGAFEATVTADGSFLDPERLAAFDAILVNNWHGWDPTKPDVERRRRSLLDFVASGKGLAGIHAAAVGLNDWPEWGELIGGRYQALPYFEADVAVVAPAHPLTAPFGGKGFRLADEFYEMKAPYDRSKLTLLLEVDREKMKDAPKSAKYGKLVRTDGDYGLSWTKAWGKGRVFYCALGHYETTYMDPGMLAHFLAGIQHALGDVIVK
jgi:hypothetical protein